MRNPGATIFDVPDGTFLVLGLPRRLLVPRNSLFPQGSASRFVYVFPKGMISLLSPTFRAVTPRYSPAKADSKDIKCR